MNNINTRNIVFDEKDIDLFNKCFAQNKNGQVGWCIKINGNFAKLKSHKSIWNKKSHAYLALINHIYSSFVPREFFQKHFNSDYFPTQRDFQEKDFWRLFITILEAKGIVQFVELK